MRPSFRPILPILLCALLPAVAGCTEPAPPAPAATTTATPTGPTEREEVIGYFTRVARRLCEKPGFLTLTDTDRDGCLDYIEAARPVCEQEARADMPARFANAEAGRAAGRVHLRCLAPPEVPR